MNLADNCSHVLGDSCGPSGSVSGDESYFNVVLFNPVGLSGDVSKNGPDSPLETCDICSEWVSEFSNWSSLNQRHEENDSCHLVILVCMYVSKV